MAYGDILVGVDIDNILKHDSNEAIDYVYLLESKLQTELPELRKKVQEKYNIDDSYIVPYGEKFETIFDVTIPMGDLSIYEIMDYFDLIEESEAEDYVDIDIVKYEYADEIREEVKHEVFEETFGFSIKSLEDEVKLDMVRIFLYKNFRFMSIKDMEEFFAKK